MSDNVTQSNKVPRYCVTVHFNIITIITLASYHLQRLPIDLTDEKKKKKAVRVKKQRRLGARICKFSLSIGITCGTYYAYARRKTTFRILGPNAFYLRSRNQWTLSRTLSRSSSYIQALHDLCLSSNYLLCSFVYPPAPKDFLN